MLATEFMEIYHGDDMYPYCRNCGNVDHVTSACTWYPNYYECPVCGAGCYRHRSGALCCVSPFCSWTNQE